MKTHTEMVKSSARKSPVDRRITYAKSLINEKKFPTLFGINVVLVTLVASTASFAAVIPNSVPAYVMRAQNLGPENPNRVIEISVDLAVRDPLGRGVAPARAVLALAVCCGSAGARGGGYAPPQAARD